MISVREEMGGAIQKYAEPIVGPLVLSHQVQYLVRLLEVLYMVQSVNLADVSHKHRELIDDLPIPCFHRVNIYAHFLFRML